MSSRGKERTRREALLEQLAMAGRDLSDAAVMFHTAVAERLGLGASDWKTVGLLQRQGPLTAGELSAQSGLAPASVTGILDRLEAGGWVRRRRDPADGRRVVVELDQAAMAGRMVDFFGGLMRRLADLYARYDDEELELLLEFMSEVARRQKEATVELA
ncbi:MAG: MarR family winged helix-turn-helix transcriptional regulator [Gemmatimonadales bacterium]